MEPAVFETAIWMPTDVPVTRMVDVACIAEEEGFDYFLVPDEGTTRDVFVALTAVAVATKRIKFGPAITNPYTRHPVTSAVAVATLDELSGGRAFMGFGIGGSLVLGPFGYTVERPLRICREAIEITRKLYSGKPVHYEGEFFKVNNIQLKFGVREIPIYFAARGSQMLRLGGELTDGVFLSGKAKFDLQRTKDDIFAGAQKSNRKQKIFYAVHVGYEPSIIQDIKANYTYMLVDSPEHVQRKLGLTEEMIEEIRVVMIREGIRGAARLISDDLLKHFIIMGDDEACALEIKELMANYQFDVFTLPVPSIEALKPMIHRVSGIIRLAQEL
jgi:5,10-methylenetetrahydromethanopterin reductase